MSDFLAQFNGYFSGLKQWQEWDQLRQQLWQSEQPWFVYFVGEAVPEQPLSIDELRHFLAEIDKLLRQDHQEEYLGIVYVDHRPTPSFIKIYDPNHLGSSCGSRGLKILPGWVLSHTPPIDLRASFPNPGGRRRWWQGLFSRA
ncbi:hypothetical protein D5085_10295 [Ectothiorhodospiraceae bacterium BW-2]|nr:hypothetical protein D5085_10295 [Ectothiorhodospiraceae bacterium BW-2]